MLNEVVVSLGIKKQSYFEEEGVSKMPKKSFKSYIFFAFWLICFNSIKYNFTAGSRNIIIAYGMLWVVLLVAIIFQTVKYMKNYK